MKTCWEVVWLGRHRVEWRDYGEWDLERIMHEAAHSQYGPITAIYWTCKPVQGKE